MVVSCIFFFKQKTAYEMRISDWSSDVCSSDLRAAYRGSEEFDDFSAISQAIEGRHARPPDLRHAAPCRRVVGDARPPCCRRGDGQRAEEIGRASCRERVCQYV